jgi:hypothetical protein
MACVGWYFYGASGQQVEETAAYKGRIIVTGEIPKGAIVLSIEAAPGQLVYDGQNNRLGCVQMDGRTVGKCEEGAGQKENYGGIGT